MDSPENGSTRIVSELIQANRRQNVRRYSGEAKGVRSVGLVGAGTISVNIAAAATEHGLSVVVTDIDEDALKRFAKRVGVFMVNNAIGDEASAAASIDQQVRPTMDLSEVARCDVVIESVIEDPTVKFEVLGQLEPKLGRETIFGSNTSTIAIERLSARLADPSRFCGLHFFPPVTGGRILEIIPGPESHSRTIATAMAFSETLDRIPLVVTDGAGFLLNRLIMSYMNGAMEMMLEGGDMEDIERVAVDFGMKMGAFRLLDEVGLDTSLHCGWSLAAESDELMVRSPVLVGMVKAKRLGRKTGVGFYSYADVHDTDGQLLADPWVRDLIQRWAKPAKEFSDETILARLFIPVVLEATRMLESGRAHSPEQVDLSVMFGMGFPVSRSGVLRWADTLGAARLLDKLTSLGSNNPRLQPSPMLLRMAEQDGRFFDSK